MSELVQPLRGQFGNILKAIPLVGVYPTNTCKAVYTRVFCTALFVLAKNWEQDKCPSIRD